MKNIIEFYNYIKVYLMHNMSILNTYEYISFKYYIFKLIIKDFLNNVKNTILLHDDDYNEVVKYAGDNPHIPHITKEK